MRVRYPIVEDHEPVWVVGQSKPIEYRHRKTADRMETPDYETWSGDWGLEEL